MTNRMLRCSLPFVATLAAMVATPASAQCRHFLYYAKTPVSAGNVPTCYTRVLGTMAQSGYSGVRRAGDEVTGSKGGAYVSVTCVPTTPRATAVVMVVGGDQGETQRVRDELRTKIAGAQGL